MNSTKNKVLLACRHRAHRHLFRTIILVFRKQMNIEHRYSTKLAPQFQ
jgi:hypothetical protein